MKIAANNQVVRAEASAWIAQLETGELDPADVDALREWTARSPYHASELQRVAQLSGELNVLTGLAESLEAAADAYRPVTRKRRRNMRLLAYPVLAGCLLVMAMGLWLFMRPGETTQSLVTSVGEYTEHILADGTMIALNTGSRVDVAFTPDMRQVSLLEGEALFRVARDRQRPFVVVVDSRRVEAVGTAFLVKRANGEFEVSVTEGRVKLWSTAASVGQSPDVADPPAKDTVQTSVFLQTGQSLKLPVARLAKATDLELQNVVVESVSEVELRRKLAWRERLLDFHHTPLSQVVAEVSRHSGKQIIIDDPELQTKQFDGLFRVGETELLIQALDLRHDIEVTVIDTNTVRLSQTAKK